MTRTLEERVTILEAKMDQVEAQVEQITSILLAMHGATRQLRDPSDEWGQP